MTTTRQSTWGATLRTTILLATLSGLLVGIGYLVSGGNPNTTLLFLGIAVAMNNISDSARSAACSAMFRQKAVLPMLGRPPTMIRSEGCSPAVRASRSVKPVATPVTAARCSCRR